MPTQGQFGFTTKVLTAGAWTSYDAIVAPGDLNGDGRGDLFVRNRRTHQAMVLPGNGSGRFRLPIGRSAAYAGYTWLTAVGDFDKDGHADLVARDARKRLVLLPGTGRATFRRPVVIAATWSYHRPHAPDEFCGRLVGAAFGAGRIRLGGDQLAGEGFGEDGLRELVGAGGGGGDATFN